MTELHPPTVCVHGSAGRATAGPVVHPIVQSSVFAYDDAVDAEPIYPRLANVDTQRHVAAKLARLEGAGGALVCSSGMAAITAALMHALRGGGHLLIQSSLYGGTLALVTGTLADLGMTHSFVDGDDPGSWAAALRPDTRAIYTEAISNPMMEVTDHAAAVEFARAHGLCSIIDATFASPLVFRPLALGYDVVVHSATKYLNGHSDLVAGVIAAGAERLAELRALQMRLGGVLDPLGCFLLDRGLKTLHLRVRAQQHNAGELARFLAAHPRVRAVHYAGLPDSPYHARARELFTGFGGMLAFEVEGGAGGARRMLDRLRIVANATSLGGVETIVCRPVSRTHRNVPAATREAMGITEGLLRLSAGVEDAADLVADFEHALG